MIGDDVHDLYPIICNANSLISFIKYQLKPEKLWGFTYVTYVLYQSLVGEEDATRTREG